MQEEVDRLHDRLEAQFPVVKPEPGTAPADGPAKQASRNQGMKGSSSPKKEPAGKRQRKLTDYTKSKWWRELS